MSEDRTALTSAARHDLPDSAFAFVESGHESEKVNGKTPDKYRHFPIHDANHVRDALSRGAQGAKHWGNAKAKVMAAAKKMGIDHGDSDDTGRSYESLYPEVRFFTDSPEIRAAQDSGDKHILGYAAVFNKISRKLGGFVERVDTRAFDASKEANWPNVVCRFNHQPEFVLGTTGADTCRLGTDDTGLQYDVLPPNHRSDVVELVERGDVKYSSFAFRCLSEEDDSWEKSEWGIPLRTLNSVELVDVAPVLDPAYQDTTAMARSMEGAIFSLARFKDADPAEIRSLMEAGQASRLFKETRRSSKPIPKLTREAADERRAVDDIAVSLRRWHYADETIPSVWTSADERIAPDYDDEETRAAMKSGDQLCRMWVDHEPCVRPTGHQGDHAPLCWSRKDGLPCAKPRGHTDEHEPMHVMARSAEESAEEETESTDADSGETLTAEAARKMLEEYEARAVKFE